MADWIRTADEVPPYGDDVLLTVEIGGGHAPFVIMAHRSHTNRDGEHWAFPGNAAVNQHYRITAWQRLPEPHQST